MIRDVSLIIPSKNNAKNITKLLLGIISWEEVPSEIILVDSSIKKFVIPEEFENFLSKYNINLKVIYGENFYPGHARNIGINGSTNPMVAFLDASTFPSNKWLSGSLKIITEENCEGLWGNTYYQADTYMKKIFRACSYGARPVQTLPGSVFKKNVFNKCGLFIEDTRAGEDADWISRNRLHKINMFLTEEILIYNELNKNNIKELLKKWFRNYTYTSKLPYFRAHKDFYFYLISFIAILSAYNWNRILPSWDTRDILYIPNVTTGMVLLLFFGYILVRVIALPFTKGEKLSFIFPVNFIVIATMSAIIDTIKALAFGYSRMVNK